MNVVRSIIFNIFYVLGSTFWSLALSWALFLPPRRCTAIISKYYGGYLTFIERNILNLKLEVRGLENLPKDRRCIIAAKHQSAYETLKIPFTEGWDFPVVVLKKELTYIPLWGRYPKSMGLVAINRGEGMESMRSMSQGCAEAIKNNRNILIFPQGTRVKPGDVKPYKPGLAKVYRDLEVPVVPLALNTGVFWGKNAFIKKSGTVIFEFLPPIEPGLPPLQMMQQLETALEAASDKLVVEAGGPPLKKA
ncbi:MAG: lysophospholipid acyltransferase family protein [Alphaproteobacteria bacterium]